MRKASWKWREGKKTSCNTSVRMNRKYTTKYPRKLLTYSRMFFSLMSWLSIIYCSKLSLSSISSTSLLLSSSTSLLVVVLCTKFSSVAIVCCSAPLPADCSYRLILLTCIFLSLMWVRGSYEVLVSREDWSRTGFESERDWEEKGRSLVVVGYRFIFKY